MSSKSSGRSSILAAQTLTIEIIDSQPKTQKNARSPPNSGAPRGHVAFAGRWRACAWAAASGQRPGWHALQQAPFRLGRRQAQPPPATAGPAVNTAVLSTRHFPGKRRNIGAPHRLTVRSKSSASHLTLSSACINRSWSDGIVCLASDCHLAAVLRAIEPVCSSSFLSSVTDTPG